MFLQVINASIQIDGIYNGGEGYYGDTPIHLMTFTPIRQSINASVHIEAIQNGGESYYGDTSIHLMTFTPLIPPSNVAILQCMNMF